VLLGTAAQQCPCQPRHDVGAQVQTKHRLTKCSNTKIHSFKVTTHKENAHLYIGGEGRPGSTIAREGQPGSNSYRAFPVPAAGAGRARVVFACWDSNPTLARGPCRARHGHSHTGQTVPCQARTQDRPCRVVRGPYLNGSCPCRPNGLSPFGHGHCGFACYRESLGLGTFLFSLLFFLQPSNVGCYRHFLPARRALKILSCIDGSIRSLEISDIAFKYITGQVTPYMVNFL
jgi:hypothetical protein